MTESERRSLEQHLNAAQSLLHRSTSELPSQFCGPLYEVQALLDAAQSILLRRTP